MDTHIVHVTNAGLLTCSVFTSTQLQAPNGNGPSRNCFCMLIQQTWLKDLSLDVGGENE